MALQDSSSQDDVGEGAATETSDDSIRWIDEAVLRLPYIPDFLIDDLIFFLAPGEDNPREAYHSLVGPALDRWATYLTKKGYRFLKDSGPKKAAGPFRVRPGKARLEILQPGRVFSPKSTIRFIPDGTDVPLVSLERKRPFDPWKPTYIKALNFIKKYKAPHPLPRAVEYALWEVEECGEVPGSVSWENAEQILAEYAARDGTVREILSDIFEKRPEDFALGSQIYLRVLAGAGPEGMQMVCDQHSNPQLLKRCHAARALGERGEPAGLDVLVNLLDDEHPEAFRAALGAIGKAGVPADHPAMERIRAFLESEDVGERVWATEALLRGGDESREKDLINLVKESELPLGDMGELGQILVDLNVTQAVPFLIKRVKSERVEIRDDAAEVLRELTGVRPDFHAHDDAGTRRDAVRKWSRWWDEYKKRRSRKSRS